MTKKPETVKAIKGFNHDLTCRDFQYEIGKTYTHEGDIEACASGFHACPKDQPFAVWGYYPPIDEDGNVTRYADVTLSGDMQRHSDKIVAASISVEVEVTLPDFVKRGIAAIKALTKDVSGDRAHAATTGDRAHAATTGDRAHAATSGDWAHAATTGDWAHAATTGDRAHAATTGYGAHAATTGNEARAATTGYGAHAATTGYGAHAATTGYGAHAATTGDWAHAATTGNEAHAATSGKNSSAMAAGYGSKVKGAMGNALHCNEVADDGKIISAACGIVGREGIEPDTWYVCKGGKLVEAAQ